MRQGTTCRTFPVVRRCPPPGWTPSCRQLRTSPSTKHPQARPSAPSNRPSDWPCSRWPRVHRGRHHACFTHRVAGPPRPRCSGLALVGPEPLPRRTNGHQVPVGVSPSPPSWSRTTVGWGGQWHGRAEPAERQVSAFPLALLNPAEVIEVFAADYYIPSSSVAPARMTNAGLGARGRTCELKGACFWAGVTHPHRRCSRRQRQRPAMASRSTSPCQDVARLRVIELEGRACWRVDARRIEPPVATWLRWNLVLVRRRRSAGQPAVG
jgi:hypothetical protein